MYMMYHDHLTPAIVLIPLLWGGLSVHCEYVLLSLVNK